jgi:hypothetical protein
MAAKEIVDAVDYLLFCRGSNLDEYLTLEAASISPKTVMNFVSKSDNKS